MVDEYVPVVYTEDDMKNYVTKKSSFSIHFPKYREQFLRENWTRIESFLRTKTMDAEINLLEGDLSISTADNCFDPTTYFSSIDFIKLVCRGVDIEKAQEIYDENTSSALVYIKRYVKDKKVFINRRNRMFGPDGMTLKAIQMITETTLIIQGGTVAIIGPERGVKNAVKIVEDVMKNVHPVFSIKELMDKKKLQKNPQDAITTINDAVSNSRKKANKESRDRKREIKKAMKAKALKVKEKLEQRENDDDDLPELPKKSKIDLQIESGEYFMNEKDKKTNYLKKKKDRQRKKISEKKEEIIEEDSIPDISNQPKKKTKKHNKIPSVKNLKEKLADFKQ